MNFISQFALEKLNFVFFKKSNKIQIMNLIKNSKIRFNCFKATLLLLLSFCFLSANAQKNLAVKTYQLQNGFTVFLNPDKTASKVFGAVMVNAGSKHDPKDATGIAHYLEHLLFKGTNELGTTNIDAEMPHLKEIVRLYDQLGKTESEEERKSIQQKINEEAVKASKYALPNEFDKLLKGMGSTGVNAYTNDEFTFYHNSFPPNQINKWLEIYSHRFENPVFRSFQSELEVVYEEKNRAMDDFTNAIFEEFSKNLFKNHPYGQQTTLGSVEHLKNPSLSKMYQFFQTYYVPNNMALILSGNFDTDEVIPMIEKKFGDWQRKPLPKYPQYAEKPFQGKETVKVRLTPVKVVFRGYRTVPSNHTDRIALDLCNYLLTNSSQTGFIDKLVLEDKVLYSGFFDLPYNDHGGTMLFCVPKIFGQSIKNATNLIDEQIDEVRNGKFDEAFLEASKNEMAKEFQLALEDIVNRGNAIGNAFNQGISWNEYLKYPDKIKQITKTQVVAIAKKYYGENYLELISKTGFPKKPKLSKPGYKAVATKQSETSAYAKKVEQIASNNVQPKFIDFQKDVIQEKIKGKHDFSYAKNPMNNIYSLSFRFGIGTYKMPELKMATQLMNYAGTEKMSLNEVKKRFFELGTSYSFSANEHYTIVSLQGLDENLPAALDLLNQILENPKISEENLKANVNQEISDRNINKNSPTHWSRVLNEFAVFGENSSYLKRYSKSELKGLKIENLKKIFAEALNYQANIHFVGREQLENVKILLERKISWKSEIKAPVSPFFKPLKNYSENIIYFLDDKKAVQSQIRFHVEGNNFQKSQEPVIDAFNEYFGGGFSGLVLQEIREYRSLAYSAGARYNIPFEENHPSRLATYIGCQGDKTNEALKVLYDLLKDLPKYEERMPNIKSNLTQKANASYPNFRNLTYQVRSDDFLDYKQDRNQIKAPKYKSLEFENVLEFYRQNLQNKPVIITIVGNSKKINLEELAKYGKIVKVSQKEIARM